MGAEHFVVAPDGAEISLMEIPAAGTQRGVCVMGHAAMVNRRTLDSPRGKGLGSEFAAAGFHTYLMDTRGHGASGRGQQEWHYDQTVALDLPAVIEFLRARHPGLPVIGLGHSISGTAMLAFQGGRDRDGEQGFDRIVTICASVVSPRLEAVLYARFARRFMVEATNIVATLVRGDFPARRMGLGSEDIPREFTLDGLRWAREGGWTSRAGVDYAAGLAHIRVPVLAVFAAGDWVWCHPRSGRRLHADIPPASLETWCLSKDTLGFVPGHMDLVKNPRSQPFWESTVQWVSAQFG